MRVRIVADKCDGFGNCAEHCPDVFKLDEWGYAYTGARGDVPEGQERLVERAILDCPVHAILEVDSGL